MTIRKKADTIKKRNRFLLKNLSFEAKLLRIFLIAMIFCAAFLLIFTLYLKDYQKSLPSNTATHILQAYREADSSVFALYSNDLPNAFENDYRLEAYINRGISVDELYYCKGTSNSPDETIYEFKEGNTHVGTLTTRETGTTTFFGFNDYEVLSYIPHSAELYTVFATKGTPLMMDQEMLCSKYPPKEGYPTVSFNLVHNSNHIDVYQIPDYDAFGSLSVQNASIEEYFIDVDEERHMASITEEATVSEKEAITLFMREFLKDYLIFTTKKDADRWAVLKKSYPGTEFYKTIQNYSNSWGKEYVSDRFKDVIIDKIKKYSNVDYSCRASLTYVIIRSDGVTKEIDFSATFYATKSAIAWLVVDMEF
ncbi:MAG: hypothetical protein EOM59_07380 [Clostridia bacterium]|nr:hypothetical protein [Clostridia bacterium]